MDRSEGGLGTGLTLARRLVELHDGTIEAFRQGPGRGSEFVVRLPLAAVPASQPVADAPRKSTPSLPLRTLVVDDNRDAAQSLQLLLELWGHTVTVANDGAHGLAAAKDWAPDVVLLDLGLPGMTWFEVRRVAVLVSPGDPETASMLAATQSAARSRRVRRAKLQPGEIVFVTGGRGRRRARGGRLGTAYGRWDAT